MKKFLFTLASFLMAGSMFATTDYCYINDFEVAEAELGTEIEVPVGIVAEALFSAYQFEVTMPEGMEIVDFMNGPDATVTYKNNRGRDTSGVPTITSNDDLTKILAAFMANEYYQDEDGSWKAAGAIMWRPGTYEEVCTLVIAIAEDFKGGEITIVSKLSCEATPIGDVVSAEYQTTTTTVTVEGGVVEPMDLTGEIIFGELDVETGKIAVSYDGPEEVTLTATINGEAVEIVDGFITLPEYGEYEVYVYANAEGYNEESRMKIFTWEEPVVVEYAETPVLTYDEETFTVTATSADEVHLFINGEEVEGNTYTFEQTDEEVTYVVTAYATAEGKENSETVTLSVVVPAEEIIVPEVTPTPEIIVTETDDAIIINVNGEGEIHVYVNGEEVEVPYTIEKGDEEQTIVVTATAQGENMEISVPAEETVVVPAKASDDPHMVGHWLVLVDENGNEEWVILYQSANNPNNWVNMYTFHHQPWGPVVRYYFVVDGVRYGAPVDMQPTAMGPIEETVQNPLYETEFYYTIEGGFTYTLGMQDLGEAKYVLCAQGGRVGVDETLAGKTIANVRYFNMAGQEMHEANGMTIVVTTYTDGTTSAVKVMQ